MAVRLKPYRLGLHATCCCINYAAEEVISHDPKQIMFSIRDSNDLAGGMKARDLLARFWG
jgi:hypothetical protein